MASYVPNAFAANPGLGAQQQQSRALRGYAPNKFTGAGAPSTTSTAPHLSVGAESRPLADDLSLLRDAGYGGSFDTGALDKAWRYTPQSYEKTLAEQIRASGADLPALREARTAQASLQPGQYITYNENGQIQYVYDEEGNRTPRILQMQDSPGD